MKEDGLFKNTYHTFTLLTVSQCQRSKGHAFLMNLCEIFSRSVNKRDGRGNIDYKQGSS